MEERLSSETNEHYTPPHIVEAARETLGLISLDPFSCPTANAIVRADSYYTKQDNGFSKPWLGRVFLNPPGGHCDRDGREVQKRTKARGPCTETGACELPPGHEHDGCESSQKKAWFKLMSERANIQAAIFVCFSVELLQTTQVKATGPVPLDFPICYPSSRLAYVREDGTVGLSPPHSSCIILVPPDGNEGYVTRFRRAFKAIGRVVVPMVEQAA